MARDFYVQPDAADPVLEAATVLAIVRRHVPNVMAVTAVDESGGEARTYAIDDDLILKVRRPQHLRARTSLAKERFFLDRSCTSSRSTCCCMRAKRRAGSVRPT